MDETGFGKSESNEEVFAEKARKHSYTRKIFTTGHISANICVSVSGIVLPTFVINEICFPSGTYREGEHTECKQSLRNKKNRTKPTKKTPKKLYLKRRVKSN